MVFNILSHRFCHDCDREPPDPKEEPQDAATCGPKRAQPGQHGETSVCCPIHKELLHTEALDHQNSLQRSALRGTRGTTHHQERQQ